MNILKDIDELLVSQGTAPSLADMLDQLIAFALVLIVVFLADILCRNILLKVMAHLIRETKAAWDDIVFGRKVLIHLSRMVAPVIIYIFIPVAFAETSPSTLGFIQCVCLVYILITFLSFISSFAEAVYSVYSEKEQLRDRSLKGMLQTVQVVLWFVGAIIVVSILIDRSPLSLLAGLGASTIILTLVLKDSIMGSVSGMQLSASDMLEMGDWIAIPEYGADGTATEVTLNTVRVHNWDSTVTTIPPYLLAGDSFQDWRGMRESGRRHVKHSINIDMDSMEFHTPEMLDEYRKIHLLKDYVEHTKAVIEEHNKEHHINNSVLVNGHRQTSLGIFRAYLTAYLRGLPNVSQELVCMVRQLRPTDHSVPMEFYSFCAIEDWMPYEDVQAGVFGYVLAITPEFDLQVFRSPFGRGSQRVLS